MTTLDLTVNDDAYEDHTDANFSSTDTLIKCAANTSAATNRRYFGAFHFLLTAEIPSGATVDAAYLTIVASSTAADDPNVDISAEDSASAPDFTTNADVTNRTRTAASVQWTTMGIGTGSTNTPSIVSVIQELVDDNGGLANGAGVVVFLDGRGDVNQSFGVVSLEGTGDPAALHIEFAAGGGGGRIMSSLAAAGGLAGSGGIAGIGGGLAG